MSEPVAEVGSSQNPLDLSDSESEVEEIAPETTTATTSTKKQMTLPMFRSAGTPSSPAAQHVVLPLQADAKSDTVMETPLKTPLKTLQDSNTNTPSPLTEKKMTPKQLEKIKEREEREKKKLEEKLARERAKEEERLKKEEKRLSEKKAKEDEKERLRKEVEFKKEQLKKEKEEKERKKLEEKEEKEKKRLEDKLKKEEEKRKKEEERRQQEEDKLKKLEEQKKKDQEEKKKKEKLKISNFFKPKATVKSSTVTLPDEEKNDYKIFNAFFVKEGVKVYDGKRLSGDNLTRSIADFDQGLNGTSDVKEWLKEQSFDDILETPQNAEYIYENQLVGAPITVKFIRFYENVKGWIGTYTKSIPDGLGKNPYMELPEFIDFDDEAGEDEEGEGEDIDDDDDASEADEEDTEDLQDFLEDDNNGDTRKKVLGPLVPVVTWKGKSTADPLFTEPVIKIEILKAEVSFPIDPQTDYWAPPPAPADEEKKGESTEEPKQKKGKTIITAKEDLELFASKVQDCDFTVPTMVEILKKELPKYTKATIENTLRALAKRVGPKPTEKKWEVNRELLSQSVETAE